MQPFSNTNTNLGAATAVWTDTSNMYAPFISMSTQLNIELRDLIKEVMESKTMKLETENDIFVFRVEDLKMWEADKQEYEISILLDIMEDDETFKILVIQLESEDEFDEIVKQLDKIF